SLSLRERARVRDSLTVRRDVPSPHPLSRRERGNPPAFGSRRTHSLVLARGIFSRGRFGRLLGLQLAITRQLVGVLLAQPYLLVALLCNDRFVVGDLLLGLPDALF